MALLLNFFRSWLSNSFRFYSERSLTSCLALTGHTRSCRCLGGHSRRYWHLTGHSRSCWCLAGHTRSCWSLAGYSISCWCFKITNWFVSFQRFNILKFAATPFTTEQSSYVTHSYVFFEVVLSRTYFTTKLTIVSATIVLAVDMVEQDVFLGICESTTLAHINSLVRIIRHHGVYLKWGFKFLSQHSFNGCNNKHVKNTELILKGNFYDL